MSDIFISYASEDRAITEKLAKALESQGWVVWWDRSIPIGKNFAIVIEETLDAAKCVVVIWSKNSVKSRWVRAEVAEAQRQNKLLPLNIDVSVPPLVYRTLQTADFSCWSGDTSEAMFIRLAGAIQKYVSRDGTDLPDTMSSARIRHASHAEQNNLNSSDIGEKSTAESTNRRSINNVTKHHKPTWLFYISAILLASLLTGIVLIWERKNPKLVAIKDDANKAIGISALQKSADNNAYILPNIQEDSIFPAIITGNFKEPTMVAIPKGCFQMGSPKDDQNHATDETDERQHKVCIEAYSIGKYEVSFDEYDIFCAETGQKTPDDHGWSRGSRPVINVSGTSASAYAKWLAKKTSKPYRLPTEAEWEYAARGVKGRDTLYPWGDNISVNKSNCDGCGSPWDGKGTSPVGSFSANDFGLYDTAGNVWEWTCSRYEKNYAGFEEKCVVLEGDGKRTARGGSWATSPRYVRSASRYGDSPSKSSHHLGFRLALSPK